MKHTTVDAVLSRGLLCFVRDNEPTVDEGVTRFGAAFHVLSKSPAVVVEGGRVRLSRRHLSPDRQRFVWGFRVFLLDRDEVLVVRWGPEGPPVFHPEP